MPSDRCPDLCDECECEDLCFLAGDSSGCRCLCFPGTPPDDDDDDTPDDDDSDGGPK